MRLGFFFRDNIEKLKIFVAGNSQYMPQGVRISLQRVFEGYLKDKIKAVELYQSLEAKKQIVFETW